MPVRKICYNDFVDKIAKQESNTTFSVLLVHNMVTDNTTSGSASGSASVDLSPIVNKLDELLEYVKILVNDKSFVNDCASKLFANSIFEDPVTGAEKNISECARKSINRAKILDTYLKK